MTSSRPSRARFGGLFAAHCFANGTPNRQNTEHKTVRLDPLTGSFRTRSRPVRTLFRPVLLTFWAKVMLEREKFSTSLGSNSRTASLPKGALRSLYPRPHRPAGTHKVLRRGPPRCLSKKETCRAFISQFPDVLDNSRTIKNTNTCKSSTIQHKYGQFQDNNFQKVVKKRPKS